MTASPFAPLTETFSTPSGASFLPLVVNNAVAVAAAIDAAA